MLKKAEPSQLLVNMEISSKPAIQSKRVSHISLTNRIKAIEPIGAGTLEIKPFDPLPQSLVQSELLVATSLPAFRMHIKSELIFETPRGGLGRGKPLDHSFGIEGRGSRMPY